VVVDFANSIFTQLLVDFGMTASQERWKFTLGKSNSTLK
jgi:hypothetical protein